MLARLLQLIYNTVQGVPPAACDGNLGTFASKRQRDGPADATAATGYDSYLACEPCHVLLHPCV